MNLQEAKDLLKNKGYKLIREDAYMDAMDQELDDIQRRNNPTPAPKKEPGNGYYEYKLTLTYACTDETMLDDCLKKFIDGTASDRAKSALGRLMDLCISGRHIDEIANMKLGDTITFTEIPVWYGKYPANPNFVKAYVRNYGEETVKKMIGLACTKQNASKLRA